MIEWMPRIEQLLCTGCGDCVKVCPTSALALVKGKAQLIHPDHCTYCIACEDICRYHAIALPFLIFKIDGTNKKDN